MTPAAHSPSMRRRGFTSNEPERGTPMPRRTCHTPTRHRSAALLRFEGANRHQSSGFTLLELLCTVAIVAILLALLLPVLEQGFGRARRVACTSQLRNIGAAFSTWAHEHGDLYPMQVPVSQGGTREFAEATIANPAVSFAFKHFQALSNELAVAKVLRCPADKYRAPAEHFAVLANSNVSYWVNLGAAFGRSDSPIVGDRNVRTDGRMEWTYVRFGASNVVEFSAELHGHRGNVLFGDGHVSLFDSESLRLAFASSADSNAPPDVTLSVPRSEIVESSGPSADAQNAGFDTPRPADSGAQDSPPRSTLQARRTDLANDAGAARGEKTNAQSAPPSTAIPASGTTRRRTPVNPDDELVPVIVMRLDGTVVTSTVPRHATNVAAPAGGPPREVMFPGHPLVELAQWIARQAARYTYWLLLLLLAALVAFELARRRAQRKRRPQPVED